MTFEPTPHARSLFADGGEMGERMMAIDWPQTPLGPVDAWPQSLRTCVRIILTSRQPMFVWWGDQLINLYNDAYRSIVGGKHPVALGQPAPLVWREIWDQVGPRAEATMGRNQGTYDEALLLIMERNGYPEETYYTFSYSPVVNDQGGTGGIICANTDDTDRIIGERRIALLREVATRAADARTWEDAGREAALALATNARDLPVALLYLAEPGSGEVTLAGAAGIAPGHAAAPARIALDDPSPPWPIAAVLRGHAPLVVENAAQLLGTEGHGAWDRPPARAVLLPIAASGDTGRAGVLVVGLNPYRPYEEAYRSFLDLVSRQIAAAVANAQAYEAERKRAETLAELDRAKTAFFSNVSHEFRTPLTLMLGPVEDALASPAQALAGPNLVTVHRNAVRLLKLVNTLLDFARFEAGRAQASYEPTDLAALTADLASAFRAAVERSGLAFTVDCPSLAGPLFVDRDMWEKIVLNLLSNALKFTFEGSIAVAMRARDGHAELTVRDTGTGIPPAELPHLFERFHRVQGARSRTHEGSGIGLALVHELVRLHGGTIAVASEVGRGTTFTVAVPFGTAHLPAERVRARSTLASTAVGAAPFVQEALRWLPGREESPPDAPAPASGASPDVPGAPAPASRAQPGARILLADDNADMRDYLARLLRERWTVETVPDGVAALAAARKNVPDLVLTDVMMPGLDGFGLLRALRGDPATRGVPVIMLSARAGEESRIEGLEAGADDYLVKPFSARELMARVTTHLEIAGLRVAAERLGASAASANRAKDEFLAMLGHELRNPLAPIVTALHLLRLREGASGASRERQIIERQVTHLVRLVDDLLDVSRITRSQIELDRRPTELASVVAKAIEVASPLLEQRRHHLEVDVAAHGLLVDADPTRLAQVVSNLLTNAAKYTPDGGHVAVRARRDGDEIELSVRDDGVGITAEMLPRVFDLFAQERQTVDRSLGGLGLGLAIVRSLVALHGGRVFARSEGTGRGTEFVVRLAGQVAEVAAPVSAEAAASLHSEAGAHGRRLRILVVDDNTDAAEMLQDWVSAGGHETRIAHDGLEALAVAGQFVPDLVLLDVGLPVMDGFEVARRLREDARLAGVTLVAVTGYGQSVDRERSAEAGFDEHLVKPVDLEAIDEVIAARAASVEAAARAG